MAETKPKLQLSNGYDLDLPQTARLLQWLEEKDMPRWKRILAAEDLGLSDRMLENIASLAVATGLIRPSTGRLTPLGASMRRIDPYLSGNLAPWILHYNLSADPNHVIWFRMANEIVTSGCSFDLQSAKQHLSDLSNCYSEASVKKHIRAEISTFCKAYTDGALTRLAYLEEQDGRFIAPSALRVPPVVFGYSLLTFANQYRQGETAIAIEDIAVASSSPGRVFLMRDADVRSHLEKLHRDDVVSIESKGHLDQVRFVNPPDPADYLLAHFEDTED